ncbi:putative dehydrogenase [Bradyrhizobium diazoefficiens]|uniref:Putative dehydrogenase n=1 Tax=Bradyrhizobium diazoefficiens TaxID=1355477 RepID=A0A0E4BLN3_9BRAD|nr:putative dehydrogenase [Bradyrhizobium diazoefficiens]
MPEGRHVAIIGAGAVGVISAIEALREGHRVTLIDPGEPGGEQAASYGNAGWLSSHSVIPPAEPGIWKKVPFYLMDPLGPLAIRWSYLPKALPWLIKYLLSGWTEARVEKTAFALRDLLKDAPLLHRKLAEEAGVSELVERNGVMHVFPSRGNFDHDLGWRLRKRVGSSGWSSMPTRCVSASRTCIRATALAWWWKKPAAAAIPALTLRHWPITRWPAARSSCAPRRRAEAFRQQARRCRHRDW